MEEDRFDLLGGHPQIIRIERMTPVMASLAATAASPQSASSVRISMS